MSTETINLELIALRQRVQELEQKLAAGVDTNQKIETDLENSASRLKKLMANIPGLVYEFCLNPDGRIYFTYISDRYAEILGIESQEITHNSPTLMNGIYPVDRKSFIESVAESGRTLKPWTWEGRIITPSQQIKWLRGFSHPEQQSNGIITWHGIFIDITETRQLEKQVKRINSIFNAQFEAGIDGILIIDEKRKIQTYNRRFCEMWQIPITVDNCLSDEEVLQQIFSQLIHPEEFLLTLDFLSEQRTAFLYNDVALKNNRVFERYSAPIVCEGGEYFGRIWYFRDISDRKRSETALKKSEIQLRHQKLELEATLKELQRTQSQLIQNEKMSSLGQLVAGVAHEINNPVNFIYGNLDHAEKYGQDLVKMLNLYQNYYPQPHAEIQAEAEIIDLNFLLTDLPKIYTSMKVGANRIREIVTSLRTFSRLDEAELKIINIHEGIDSTLMILEHRLKGKSGYPTIKIIKKYGILPLIECYAGQLNQVFMNILANAIDALETGIENKLTKQPTIEITSEVIDRHNILIRIIDNGTGITEEVKQRLFDPFYTTKPVGKGTGMGLSISYQIVTERHQGSLECKSIVGEGTEFIVKLPIKAS
ncbi:ATP-binding protein [Calothrix sp. PCC 6303]|uniref:PAS domain-containing sensor histidine kinase n=1 Tax=Calothrix sp. PCC 6303 TaxID=1170562 RepID=UPI0002A02A71|nr:ATP-binding protein [Calothrix sp. PCC 6303]AFY99847.1 PAS/PAC sensor signal transduction histidine kinase [Calothrix sp. PCC 6303]